MARHRATPVRRGVTVDSFTIESRALGKAMPIKVAVPVGGAMGRPLLVFLHGRGDDEGSELFQGLFDALTKRDAPVVAFPYGGDASYWHDRKSGAWGRYVVSDVIPQVVRRYHLDAKRVAIGGISMGGFGALNLARLHPGFFCAVGAHSPALWRRAGETAPGAFDDAKDFAQNDVIGSAQHGAFQDEHLWIDIGSDDPFVPGVDAIIKALADGNAETERFPGGHGTNYWRTHFARYMTFYTAALRDCGTK